MSSDYLKLNFIDSENEADKNNCQSYGDKIFPFARSKVYFVSINLSEKLTNGEDVKTVYRLALDIKGISEEFLPGDTIGVIPHNEEMVVDKILLRLNVNKFSDKTCKIEILENTTKKNPTLPKHIPARTTLRKIFLNNVDILTPPKKLFLKSLLRFTKDPEEVAKLEHVCSTKGSKEYGELITGTCKTLLGLLNTFPSCQPPVEIILEHLPPLQPRPYSISSSPLIKNQLEITFFVLEKDDGTKGLCTGWLEHLIEHHKSDGLVPFYFRQSNNFRLQDFPGPMILIATGTGLAPFRGFLQHRYSKYTAKTEQREVPDEIWLFYGCRYHDRDWLYREEIMEYVLCSGILTKCDVALSRQIIDEKRYVQDIIREQGEQVLRLILEGAKVFVCGNARTMLKDVRECLIDLFRSCEQIGSSEAQNYLDNMEKKNLFVVDSWN